MTNESRGEAIKRRRLALGIHGLRQFAEATHRDRQTLARAEEGTASESTMDWLEAWLTREEAEAGISGDAPPMAEPVRIEMRGVSASSVEEIIVSGPVDRPEEIAEAVGRIIERLRSQGQ